MALDFPTSPTDGQIYDNYYWDNTNSVWRLLSDSLEIPANFSNTATGTYTDGFDYKYVSFTSDGTLTVTRGGYADILVVGGGGGGGGALANSGGNGGGGAGGFLYAENYYLSAGNHTVKVGAGGAGSPATRNVYGDPGEPSYIGKLLAVGGGVGADQNNLEGHHGGSGGGGGGESGSVAGLGVESQGNNGGVGVTSANYGAGGGGGAGAVGGNGTTSVGGNGGDGLANSITGSSVYYAGGGGGGVYAASTGGSGGLGGGGDAGQTSGSNGLNGTANTGGGGGGGTTSVSVGATGGDGGSGIVIVRVRTN